MIKQKLLICTVFALALFIVPMATGAMITMSGPNQIYSISLSFDQDKFSIDGARVMEGKAPDRNYQPATGLQLEVVSANDEILDSFVFTPPTTVCSDTFGKDPASTDGCKKVAKGNFSLEVPYYPTGKTLNLNDANGKMIANYDISVFERICGDGKCDANENFANCPQDCKSGIGDGVCDKVADGICDPDCPPGQDKDCGQTLGGNSILILVVVIIVLIVVALIGFFIWKKVKESGEGQETESEGQ